MRGREKTIAIIIIMAFIMLTTVPTGAVASSSWSRLGPGPVGGQGNITLTRDGIVSYSMNGTVPFSVYFMTGENLDKAYNNQTFAYIQELSVINITSATVQGNLPAGTYGYLVVASNTGIVGNSSDGIVISYPSNNNNVSIPWDTIAIIALTAAVSVLATYAIMRSRNRIA